MQIPILLVLIFGICGLFSAFASPVGLNFLSVTFIAVIIIKTKEYLKIHTPSGLFLNGLGLIGVGLFFAFVFNDPDFIFPAWSFILAGLYHIVLGYYKRSLS